MNYIDRIREKIQKWLFGHWRSWWFKRHVRQYAWQHVLTAEELMNAKNPNELRQYLKTEATVRIAHAMMKDGTIVFEEKEDYSTPSRIITARTYAFSKSPLSGSFGIE